MQRSNHRLMNNSTWVSFSAIYLSSAEVFQNGNKCFKASLYYPNCRISPWHEVKNPEDVLTWTVGNPNASAILSWHSTTTLELTGSEQVISVEKKRWLRGDLIVVFNYLLGDYRKEGTSCHRCTVKQEKVTHTSYNREILNVI